jgi:hypothetical protein
MYTKKLTEDIGKELVSLKEGGRFKVEREIEGAQFDFVRLNVLSLSS